MDLTHSPQTRLLACLMALTLVFQPNISHGRLFGKKETSELPVHRPAFDGQEFEGLGYFDQSGFESLEAWNQQVNDQIQQMQTSNRQKIQSSGFNMEELSLAYANFYLEKMPEILAIKDEIGKEEFLKRLETRDDDKKISFVDADLGELRITNINGEPAGRIVHAPSGVAFLITHGNSKHLEVYRARQTYDSGRTREVKEYKTEDDKTHKIQAGRDHVVITVNEHNFVEQIELSPRQKGLKEWWLATVKKPTAYDLKMGLVSGSAQSISVGILAYGVSLFFGSQNAEEVSLAIAAFTHFFGFGMGVVAPTYHNWRKRGSKFGQDLKNMVPSLVYYFSVYAITHAGLTEVTVADPSATKSQIQAFIDSVSSFFTDPVTAATGTHFLLNFWINNQSKGLGYTVSDIHEEAGLDDKKVFLGLRKRDVNRQMTYYLPTLWLKFLDQVWFASTIGASLTGDLPVWTPFAFTGLYTGLTFLGARTLDKWAYNNYPVAAAKLNLQQRTRAYFWPERLVEKTKAACSKFLSRNIDK